MGDEGYAGRVMGKRGDGGIRVMLWMIWHGIRTLALAFSLSALALAFSAAALLAAWKGWGIVGKVKVQGEGGGGGTTGR